MYFYIAILYRLGDNGIEWKSLLENKLNKHFDWEEVFKAALNKKEGITLEQVNVIILLCTKPLCRQVRQQL